MTVWRRFAAYWAPEPGPLAAFCAAWLGRDAETGRALAHPPLRGLPRPAAELTAEPRVYGLHATLKPPFRSGAGEAEIAAALEALAAGLAPVEAPPLRFARLGGFLALVPSGESPALSALAMALVEGLDRHRLPPPEAELARRRAAGLTARQEALLARWGYPYVGPEFRFHVTLTGRLAPEEAAAVEAALAPALAPLLPPALAVREVALFGEGEDGLHRLIRRFALRG